VLRRLLRLQLWLQLQSQAILEANMDGIVAPQNMRRAASQGPKPYGVRVSLPPGDPFRKIMGAEWHRTHWFATVAERDAELVEMSRRHEYSRIGDRPALVFEKVENLAASRGL
jgi:hypothetical protein